MASTEFKQFVLLLLVLSGILHISEGITVKTATGYLSGSKRDVVFGEDVYTIAKFLGIRYAQPPVGNLRFMRPMPLSPSTEHFTVNEYGSRCLEVPPQEGVVGGSEDCLFLNIVVPDKLSFEAPLAVMIYIHGGGFTQGTSGEYYTDLLAAAGHTIIVTINYRLSVWGFLSTGDDRAPGNYGLWDQHMAIRWIHDNIGAFGGDKDRITIFGESAGAVAVMYQGMFPGNKGLFHRMIAQSGSAAAYWGHDTDPRKDTDDLANATGCYSANATTMLRCLRNLPIDTIQSAAITLSASSFDLFFPSVDNIFVTCDPEDVLDLSKDSEGIRAARDVFATFDFLIGVNSNEGGEALYPPFVYEDPENFLPTKTTFDEVKVPLMATMVYGNTLDASTYNAVVDAIIQEYTDATDPMDPTKIRIQYLEMYRDVGYLAPAKTAVNCHAEISTKHSYLYYFSVNPTYHVIPVPSWFEGANHADDILFVFPSENYTFFTEQEVALAFQMVAMWTNFAKTGNPNLPLETGIQWDPYTTSSRLYLDLTTNMTSANLKAGLLEGRANFWNNELSAIVGDIRAEPCRYEVSKSPTLMKGPHAVIVICLAILLFTH